MNIHNGHGAHQEADVLSTPSPIVQASENQLDEKVVPVSEFMTSTDNTKAPIESAARSTGKSKSSRDDSTDALISDEEMSTVNEEINATS